MTSWDPDKRFYSDCRAAGSAWCDANNYDDIHNVSAHEMGHWFHLGHSGDNNHTVNTSATMYGYIPEGEWRKRDLTTDDITAGAIVYGYR